MRPHEQFYAPGKKNRNQQTFDLRRYFARTRLSLVLLDSLQVPDSSTTQFFDRESDGSAETGETMTSSILTPQTNRRTSLLFVDDEPQCLVAFRRMLRPMSAEWNSHFLSDSRTTMDVVRQCQPDVVITDLFMPFVSGIEIIEELQKHADTKNIPVIVITGQNDRDLKRRALDAGAADLLNRPFEYDELLARIRNSERLKAGFDELNSRNNELECRVQERTRQLRQSRLEVIARLGKAAEYRDGATGCHVIRVAHYSRLIAMEMRLPLDEVETIFAAAPLHDVGKIAISDSILLKSGLLTDEERLIMQTHCLVGERLLGCSVGRFSATQYRDEIDSNPSLNLMSDPVLDAARQIAATHHERWDGTGYPNGLSGEQIPLAGRIVAVADVFDALTTTRPYKSAYSTEDALQIMAEQVGKHFDPVVHAAFLQAMPEIELTRLRFRDGSPIPPAEAIELASDTDRARELEINQSCENLPPKMV